MGQTLRSTGGIVGVQGAEHQVTGQGSLNRCFGGFEITGFSHQQNVRVLAHEGPQ